LIEVADATFWGLMKIESIAWREIHMRLKAPFETSFGIVQNRRSLLVETIVDGVSGWGKVTAGETPGYNAETTERAWHVLSDFIAPSVIGKNILDASEFPALMSHIRGHERAINIQLGRVAGHTEARCVQEVCRHHSIPVWCGGMLESGIGRAPNIAMSTLEGFTLRGDVSANKRYWDEDIIEPEVEVTSKGAIHVPKAPGLGYSVRRDRIETAYCAHHQLDRAVGHRVGQKP
jgi:L-alanine-DL-glutamate epimerase-like enolase superfamily enzyme